MSESPKAPSDLGIKLVEGKSFDEVTIWLERALRRIEPLPMVVQGESAEGPILRRERGLSEIARQDLRNACRLLVRRFVNQPKDDDDYVAALLQLAKGFNLTDTVTDLHKLAADADVFAGLAAAQVKSVLFTLLDLRAPLPLEFWKTMASGLPGSLSVIAVSGLLGHGYESALRVLPSLPDDQSVADSLYVILDQHGQLLNKAEAGKMAEDAKPLANRCKPQIKLALEEWANANTASQEELVAASVSNRSPLDSALAAFAARIGQKFELQPAFARLVPQPSMRLA